MRAVSITTHVINRGHNRKWNFDNWLKRFVSIILVSRQNKSVFFTTASKEVDGLDKLLLTGAIQATAAVLHHHHIHHRTGYVSALDAGHRCKHRKATELKSKPGHKLSPTNLPLQKPLIHLLCTLLRMDIRNRLSTSGPIATVRGKIRLWRITRLMLHRAIFDVRRTSRWVIISGLILVGWPHSACTQQSRVDSERLLLQEPLMNV